MTFAIDHKFSPRNETEVMFVDAIEQATGILIDKLGLENLLTLRVERMNGWGNKDAFHAGKYVYGRNSKTVKINIRNLYGCSLNTIIIVLSHEVRHAAQDLLGLCDELPDTVYPTNSRHYYLRRYLNQRVEKDARKYQTLYAQMVFDSPDFTFKNQLETCEGEIHLIEDHIKTAEKMGWSSDSKIQRFAKKDDDNSWWLDLSKLNELTGKKYRSWTSAPCKLAWEYQDHMQIVKKVMVPVTLDDLVS